MTTEEREQSLFEIHRHIMFLATRKELDEVIRSVKTRRNDLSRKVISELCVGDSVLIDNKGRVERGTIRKINRTRAVIDIENKGGYNVPFSMIRKES